MTDHGDRFICLLYCGFIYNSLLYFQCRASYDDAAIRGKLLALLTSSPSNCRQWQQLGRDVISELVSRHREMLGRRGVRCYANSVEHRQSHRIMTAVLLLGPYIQV